jgi:hypothetical protein
LTIGQRDYDDPPLGSSGSVNEQATTYDIVVGMRRNNDKGWGAGAERRHGTGVHS